MNPLLCMSCRDKSERESDMSYSKNERSVIDANKSFFERDAEDFDKIFDNPKEIKNWLTRIVTVFYCKDHIKLRLNSIVGLVKGGISGKRVCELGCGPGRYPLYYHAMGANVVGVDYSSEMIKLAKANRQKAKVREEECRFVESDVLEFSDSEHFDVVVASGLIDYLPNHLGAKLIEKMVSLVKPNGQIIITFPFKGGFFNMLRYFLRRLQKVYTYYYGQEEIDRSFAKNCIKIINRKDIVGYWIIAGEKTLE